MEIVVSLGIIVSSLLHVLNEKKKWTSPVLVLCLGVGIGENASDAHDVVTDRVGITFGQGHLFGMTSGEGITRQALGAGEQVLVMEAKGVTGFVQTTTRLFGFSGTLQRWVSITLPTSEHILKWAVTPRMIVAQGQQATYGFQSDRGRWKREPWGAGESLQESAVKDSIAVLITDRRALGFSAITGGFFSQDLPVGNHIPDIQINDHVVILHLSDFMLVFRSGLAIWAEVP
jgi:hypothetical protein